MAGKIADLTLTDSGSAIRRSGSNRAELRSGTLHTEFNISELVSQYLTWTPGTHYDRKIDLTRTMPRSDGRTFGFRSIFGPAYGSEQVTLTYQ
jgi:hypothetical protein